MTEKIRRNVGGHPTAARVAEIDAAIVVATLTVFARLGDDFSMDQVAGLAGVSKQAIYRRFDGKVALLLHALDVGAALLVSDTSVDLPADPVDALHTAAWRLFGRGERDSIGATIFLEAAALTSSAFRLRLLESRRVLDTAIIERLAQIDAAGRLRAGSIALYAQVLLDLLLGVNIRLNTDQHFAEDQRRAAFDDRWRIFEHVAILPQDPPERPPAG